MNLFHCFAFLLFLFSIQAIEVTRSGHQTGATEVHQEAGALPGSFSLHSLLFSCYFCERFVSDLYKISS